MRSCASGWPCVLGEIDDEVDDALPVALDSLELWDVGQRLLHARLDGLDGNAAIKAEIARGTPATRPAG